MANPATSKRTAPGANPDIDPDEADVIEQDAQDAEPEPEKQYLVVHQAVNVWDADFDRKEARKDRVTRRLLRGEVHPESVFAHADIARLIRLGSIRPVNTAPVPVVEQLPDVPEAEGAKVPQDS